MKQPVYKLSLLLLQMNFIFLISCNVKIIENERNFSKPNLIVILTDDQGYGDLGSYGSGTIKTPNIDQLAKDGMKFTDFYVHPICSPTRAALLTGSYAPRAGFPDVQSVSPFGLNPEEVTIAEVLKKEGYTTAHIGKWHLGEEDLFSPNNQGVDYFYGIRLVNGTQKFETFAVPLYQNDSLLTIRPEHSRFTQDFTSESLQFISQNKNRPFFLYLAYTMPHIPIYPGRNFRGRSGEGLYADAIEEIDWSVGRIVDKLKQEGLENNTLIMYLSDNGPWLGHGDQSGSAGPLRGGKKTTWEGGIRVPFIARWKNKIPASSVNSEVVGIIDIAPTLAAIAGTEMPKDRKIDGKNIYPLLIGEENGEPLHKAYYNYAGTSLQSIRSGKWKLHFARPEKLPAIYGEYGRWFSDAADTLMRDHLYNLEKDIGETKNVASEHPEVVQRLTDLANKAREDIGDYNKKGKNSRPTGYAHSGFKDASQYRQSPKAKEAVERVMKEMRAFQRARFEQLLMQKDMNSLNKQQREELNFYREQLKW